MKRKYFLLCLFPFFAIAQTQEIEPLKQQLQVGLSFQGLDITYQQPLSNRFLLTAGLGGGLMNHLTDNPYDSETIGVSMKSDRWFSPFTRLSARYIYNRAKRVKRESSIINNVGNYIAFQNKFSFGGTYGTVMINEFHWGIQLPLGKDMLFETHIGLGKYDNLKTKAKKVFPTVGFEFSYVIF